MNEYKNIERIHTLEDGSMNVLLRNGKRAIVEIRELNEKFQAAVYGLFTPDLTGAGQRKDTLARLGRHDAYKDCAKEALGWIDENPLETSKLEEIKEFK